MDYTSEVQDHLKSLTVLLVEDEEVTRELCSEFLTRLTGLLVTAENGAEGLEAWRQHKPDIIITDIRMPVMDGLVMLQEIRSVDSDVQVFILSAFEEFEYLRRSIDLGAYGYAVKPVEPARITESLLKCARGLLLEKKNRLAQAAVASNFRFMQKLTNVIPGMLAYWSTELRCIFCNTAYREWFGKTADQMHGIGLIEVIGENMYLMNKEYIDAAFEGVPRTFERATSRADGSIGHLLIHYIPDLLEDNAQGFFVMMVDVTELKLVEAALKERNKELGCLYSIISLSNDPGISFDDLLKRAVMRIPPAWQFPEITEACIEIGGKSFQTARFEETPWMLAQEIITKENKVGKVTVCYREEQAFLPEELALLNAIAENIGLIIMRELAKETISRLALTDELTGLNNRRFFNESFTKALSTARRHRQPLSLISIDLDYFKKVNDTFGHTMGDLVLKEFSHSLKMMVRVEDVACRLGGEEFIVLLPNTTCEAAVTLADRMRCCFEQYPRTTTPVVTASFGVAQLQEGDNEDSMMRRADDALYQAKHEGRNRVVAARDASIS